MNLSKPHILQPLTMT